MDIGFTELDDATDARLRKQAWEQYVNGLLAADAPILGELDSLGLEIRWLESAFLAFCDYPDVAEWPADAAPLPDLAPARKSLEAYVDHMRRLAGDLPVDAGRDSLMPKYRQLTQVVRFTDVSSLAGLMGILERFREMPSSGVVQRNWPGGRQQALAELARWNEFAQHTAQPLVQAWREHRYGPVLRAIRPAQEQYDQLRRAAGSLNYQDLLMQAADLLRDKPAVRAYFRRRFSHLLVDEFQDTDPVQAEVMLLLTAESPQETDWRRCRPVGGSLFVVGDPKQSIYRFRRADIVTYNQVKGIIRSSGGLVAALSANFRTVAPLVQWINATFDGVFPAEATAYAPANRPMLAGRTDEGVGQLVGVRTLNVGKQYSNQAELVEYEADLVARTIRAAIDGKLSVPRTAKEIQRGASPAAAPGDFLIVARNTHDLSVYGEKLKELDIPHQITGGTSLNEVDELSLLHTCLAAVVRPDDPVALVAALRSELFGTSDPELYAFQRAGGRFSCHAAIPDGLAQESADRFRDAFDRLRQYARWMARLPPVAAIEKIVADLGISVLACTAPGASTQAGSLAKGLELLRKQEASLWTAADLVDYLGQILNREEKYDGLPARPHEAPTVRIMNLHKVKGLEAAVVFLVDPTGERDHEVDLHVDRSGDRVRGYLAIYGPARGRSESRPLLAHPRGWDALAAEEQKFREAENDRLLYVAATRAGTQLAITLRESRKGSNPWGFFEPHLGDSPVLEDPGSQAAPLAEPVKVSRDDVHAALQGIHDRWETCRRPTYATVAAKALSVTEAHRPATTGEHGTEWGTLIHLLLETAMRRPAADLRALAESVLAEQGLEPGLVETALETVHQVTRSAVWRRAKASPQCLVEVPFQMLLAQGSGALSATGCSSASAECTGRQAARGTRAAEIVVPTVLRGVIDLTFHEHDGWVLVDYKTDRATLGELAGLVEHYCGQLQSYSAAWTSITGERVQETGLYFTHPDKYVPRL